MRPNRCLPVTLIVAICVVAAGCSSDSAVESTTVPSPTALEATTPVEGIPDDSDSDESNGADTTSTTTANTTSMVTTTTEALTAEDCVAEVALEVRIGQLLFPVVVQADFPQAEELAERGLIAGVVVLGEPSSTIAEAITSLQSRALVSPSIVAVDEEGGRVQRVASLVGSIPSARDVASSMSVDEAEELAHNHAVLLGGLGFTMNLAPVVDLDNGGFIRDRAYAEDVDTVTEYAFATADGILAAGLTPVVKHFPGHGRGTDSHTGLPTLPDLETLRESDLVPFTRAIARADVPIMVGHLVVPGLTDGKPATLSAEAIDGLLRTELGFDGLVMTDALNMDAIADSMNNAEAAEQALIAGVDLVMLGQLSDVEATIARLVEAIRTGRLSEQTVNDSFVRSLGQRQIELCSLPEALLPAIGCRSGAAACSTG